MKKTEIRDLIRKAVQAQQQAYAPYSGFYVGAALLCADGTVYTGCNVENASYPAGNCAERTAVFKAASEGKREFAAIAIVGGKEGRAEECCTPCGICRQVLSEFCDPEAFSVICAKDPEEYEVYTLAELLPYSFAKKSLQQ